MQQDAQELVRAIDRLSVHVETLQRFQPQAQGSTNRVTINAGGVGVWLSALCAVTCLVSFVFGAVLLVRQGQEIQGLRSTLETQQAYINVLHQGVQE